MVDSHSAALAVSRRLVRLLIVANWVAGVLIFGLLIASVINPGFVLGALGFGAAPDDVPTRVGLWMIMVIGIVATPITNAILKRLLAIIDTVRAGDPFIAENAARLTTIAWALLALNLMHVVYGMLASVRGIRSAGLHVDMSPTRWLAVFLLFVLARVFEHGAQMRDDLEGTV